MIRIDSVEHDNSLVNLIPKKHRASENNVYTIIVGKNGVGKSRLLYSITKAGINYSDLEQHLIDHPHIHFDRAAQVIAISTSPFDKFPTAARSNSRQHERYKYVGMRDGSRLSTSSAISLIASASKGLLQKILNNSNSADFLEVFSALSFSPLAEFILKPAFTSIRTLDDTLSKSSSVYFNVSTTDRAETLKVDTRFQRAFERLSTEEKSNIGYAMSNVARFFHERKAIELAINFQQNTVALDGQKAHPHIINSILMLMDIGLIRLMDLRLHKLDFGMMSLRRASSGEQCLIMLILGIAGYIEDGSLILIDEPEVSLHPRWQEEFMQLLSRSFWRYRHCQFVIATHSPQIVSRLGKEESFILSLPNGVLYEGEKFNKKSADFQLAELFDAPGIMNEYISRVTFDLIAKVRSHKTVTTENLRDMRQLKSFRERLSSDDPIIQLIDSADELVRYYANDI